MVCCNSRKEISHKGPPSTHLNQIVDLSKHNHAGFFKEHGFVNHQGLQLHAYSAQPIGKKRGIVICHHGVRVHALFEFCVPSVPGGAHDSVDGGLLGALLAAGYAVYTFDAQGHGLSDSAWGEPFFVEKFDDYATDLLQFSELVRKEESAELPMFAMGISLGGAVVVRAAITSPSFVKGLVLYAPMLSLEKLAKQPINRILRPVASLVSAVFPTLRIAHVKKNEKFPLIQEECDNDALCDHGDAACARMAYECISFSDFMTQNDGFSKVTTPFITFHSPHDTYVDPESSEGLMQYAQTEDKEYVQVPEMWHALTVEPGKEKIFEGTVAWLSKRS